MTGRRNGAKSWGCGFGALVVVSTILGCSKQPVEVPTSPASAHVQQAESTARASAPMPSPQFVTHGDNSPISVGEGAARSAVTYGKNSPIAVVGATTSASSPAAGQ